MTTIKRGKAQVTGCVATFDVILYPVQQSMKASQDFELEVTKDASGDDTAWKAQNEMVNGDIAMKLLGDTESHAEAGAAFLAPLAVVTITGCDAAIWNTTWCVMNGGEIDLGNTKVGDISFKLRRYVNSTQNTAFSTTPS